MSYSSLRLAAAEAPPHTGGLLTLIDAPPVC